MVDPTPSDSSNEVSEIIEVSPDSDIEEFVELKPVRSNLCRTLFEDPEADKPRKKQRLEDLCEGKDL
jgi:hypothetical protein